MKILVYGAGVLGSFLAHALHRGGNDVTFLARGNRLSELRQNGLVIRHYLKLRTTTDRIPVVDKLGADDYYDIIFIVMQRTQIDAVLPAVCANGQCPLFVFVGNNPTAYDTYQTIKENSTSKKTVLFGFQGTGGRRENGKVVSVSFGGGSMTVGSMDGSSEYQAVLSKAFENTKYKLRFSRNMDVWLKCHAAFILPAAFLIYQYHGNLRKASKSKAALNHMIDAIDEGYRVIAACGYPIEPEGSAEFVRSKRKRCYRMLKIIASTPLGRLIASDHAMSAVGEMKRLSDDFDTLKQKAGIATPAWDELEQHMKRKAAEEAAKTAN